jgi:hypothetical protein
MQALPCETLAKQGPASSVIQKHQTKKQIYLAENPEICGSILNRYLLIEIINLDDMEGTIDK